MLVAQLFDGLLQAIDGSGPGKVWAAIPEVIDWTSFDSFRFGSAAQGRGYDDITLDRMVDHLDGEAPTLELLQRKRVYCIAEGNPHPIHAWSFLKCLTAEVIVNSHMYLLNAGTWCRISTEFLGEIEQDLQTLLYSSPVALPTWGDEHEDVYNSRVAGQSGGHLALMDCVMISHSGMPSPVEFCDLYSDDQRLVHVKRYGQSSVLSHLFMQGFVSADCLLSDPKFRHAVNARLPVSHCLSDPDARPLASAFEVAFAIGSMEMGKLQLPFFSRVTLRNVARTLTQSYGYRVSLTKIAIDKFVATQPS